MLSEFEEPENTNHREELDKVFGGVREEMREHGVAIKAHRGHKINYVNGTFQKAETRRAEHEADNYLKSEPRVAHYLDVLERLQNIII